MGKAMGRVKGWRGEPGLAELGEDGRGLGQALSGKTAVDDWQWTPSNG
jgi:hypothetical protein